MIRVKLPLGGITPDQLDAFADVDREVRAAEQGPHHDAPEHPAAPRAAARRRRRSSASSPTPACPRARAAATPCATSPATRGPASATTSSSTSTPYAGAYVRYFVRHPTTQMMPRKIKTAFDGAPDADRSLTGIHDIAFLARERDGVRGVEVRVGGGTSIMPRVAPTLYEFVGLDDGEYLKVAEAVLPDLRPHRTSCASTAPARASRCSSTRSASTRFREMVDEELQGDWVAERDFDVDGLRFDVDEEALRPGRADDLRVARTATCRRSSASPPPTCRPSARTGFCDRRT